MSDVQPGGSGEGAESADRTVAVIARVLGIGTVASVSIVALASILNVLAGRAPLAVRGPDLTLDRLIADLTAVRPEGLLWLGLVLVVALPTARVLLALVGYARAGDRYATAGAAGVLFVLATSVVVALAVRSET